MQYKAGNVVIHNFTSGPEIVVISAWEYSPTHYLGLEAEYDGEGGALSELKKKDVGSLLAHSVLDLLVDCGNEDTMRMIQTREDSA